MSTLDVPVLGMTCAACVRRVERAAQAAPGVARAEVNLVLSRARLEFDDGAEPSAAIAAIAAIRAAGYEVPADALATAPAGGTRLAAIEQAHADETTGLRRAAMLALAATVPLLVLAMSHGRLGVPVAVDVVVQAALGTLVVLGPGRRYLRAARFRHPDMNTLIALGAGVAWLASVVAVARWWSGPRHHPPALYFEAGAAIVAFVMLGKLLEARARARLAGAVRSLLALAPAIAHRRDGDREDDVDAATLAPGDTIAVRPGERIPADGTVLEGRSAIDQALLTGESLPVDVEAGAAVYAGTLNHHGALGVRVARAGADTALARIARVVEDAQATKPPIARLADRVAGVFVPAVIAIAAATALGWWAAGAGGGTAIERLVAVLVIACPCALGLATPAAIAAGTARGAALGILYRSGEALERAARVDVACLDKTGTLTTGAGALIEVSPDLPLALVAAAEQASEHPIARAIVAGARARGLALPAARDVVATPGGGITAQVDGHRVVVGTRAHVGAPADAPEPAAGSVAHAAIDGRYAGHVVVADPPAEGAAAAIAGLRALAIEPIMITGDREAPARWIAGEVGITRIHAGVAPTDKAAHVARERAAGHRVAMVGDGLNDVAALAAADVGISLGAGVERAGDIALRSIAQLPAAFALARATLRTIHRNLAAASIYNLVCIPVAAAGWLSPVLASAAMSLSSVSVLLSSLALRRW